MSILRGRRFRKCGPRESRDRSSSCVQKRAKKSTLSKSTVDACNEKRLHFKEVIETQKELIDTDGFDWLESTELAIDKRKFLLNRLYQKQPIPQDED